MPNLTPLELTALRLLNRGLTYTQIAAGLGISPTLAHKHVLAVYAKLHVNNRLDAIRAAVALDLIAPIEEIPAAAIELTRREQKVLELIQQGCTTAQISAQLGLASATVRNYIAALHRKFGTRNRTQLLQKAPAPTPPPAPPAVFHLAPREIEILQHLAAGQTRRETARELGLSDHALDLGLIPPAPPPHPAAQLEPITLPPRLALRAPAGEFRERGGKCASQRGISHPENQHSQVAKGLIYPAALSDCWVSGWPIPR